MSDAILEETQIELERYELRAAPPYRFTLSRRDLFHLLGAGMLVLVCGSDTEAQESGGGRQRRQGGFGGGAVPQNIEAWLHIAENGAVTAYTGKVDVGQNSRTSLTQAVAEELRTPVATITMVMADTKLTPYDMGTFGSQTTPRMFPQLRRAAAAAREQILTLAAQQWQVDRANLTAADGAVTESGTHRTAHYGDLLKGQKLTQTIGPEAVLTPADHWKVAGTSVPKVDGRDFVTGKHRYASDIKREGMLFGKILRPAGIDATLKSVNTRAAESLPGVTVVHDGDFVGVTAKTQLEAEKALAAIKAEWQFNSTPSDKDLFNTLHPGLGAKAPDPAGGLAASYTIAYIAHAPLEPRAAVAEWEGDHLMVWTGSQRPFGVRQELVSAFHLPEENVHVIVPDTGSGYGGKHTGEAAIEAARLAKSADKPVKLVWTREEEFSWAYFRPAGVIDVSGAVDSNGILTAWTMDNYNSGGSALQTPYHVPGAQTQFHQARSPLKQGSYRGLAGTANHFARESHMDDLAHLAKLDPLEFRRKNIQDDRLRAVLEAAAKQFGWADRKKTPGKGFGLACGTEKGSYVANIAEVEVDRAAGKVTVVRVVAAFECGAVINPTHLQNQVEGAVVMGIGGALFEAIKFDQGKLTNPHFAGYRVPRFMDAPPIEVVLVDRKDLTSAGAGETPIMAIAPAIGNAIFDATGTRLRSLPMIPDGLKA